MQDLNLADQRNGKCMTKMQDRSGPQVENMQKLEIS